MTQNHTFQDPCTPVMEGIVDLHTYIMFYLAKDKFFSGFRVGRCGVGFVGFPLVDSTVAMAVLFLSLSVVVAWVVVLGARWWAFRPVDAARHPFVRFRGWPLVLAPCWVVLGQSPGDRLLLLLAGYGGLYLGTHLGDQIRRKWNPAAHLEYDELFRFDPVPLYYVGGAVVLFGLLAPPFTVYDLLVGIKTLQAAYGTLYLGSSWWLGRIRWVRPGGALLAPVPPLNTTETVALIRTSGFAGTTLGGAYLLYRYRMSRINQMELDREQRDRHHDDNILQRTLDREQRDRLHPPADPSRWWPWSFEPFRGCDLARRGLRLVAQFFGF